MFQANAQIDPIVEILRLAYRRGLAIQREQAEKSQAIHSQTLQDDVPVVSVKPVLPIEKTRPPLPTGISSG